MDPDRSSQAPRAPIDDTVIAGLVRDLADEWRMPPQRLDESTWRDRVGRGSRGRAGGPGGRIPWPRRLLGATAVAVIATVSLSFVAVWLTAPRGNQGTIGASASASPSHAAPSAGPAASPLPASSPLPKLVQNGPMPAPSTVLIRTEDSFRLVDLTTGTLGEPVLSANTGPATVLARPGGGWVCLCGTGYSPQAVQLSLVTIRPDGTSPNVTGTNNGVFQGAPVLLNLEGAYDPNVSVALQPMIADAAVTTTPDQRFALVGWIKRGAADGWVMGVDVLDLASLAVTSSASVTLPEPATSDGHGRVRTAPHASVSPDGSTLLLSSFWFLDQPNTPTPEQGTDHWTVPFADGVLGLGKAAATLAPAGSSSGPECLEFEAGAIDQGSYYTVCRRPGSTFRVDRVGLHGAGTTSIDVPASSGPEGESITTQTADALFLWDAASATVTRVDFATGAVTTRHGTASSPGGPLDRLAALGRAFGHLIAPVALAKDLLEPGMVASPDGRRVFAIGRAIDGASTGIDAFDADTLSPLWHQAPVGDFSSIAISADGGTVYASAPGGIAPDGSGSPDAAAAMVALDAASGEVRVLAGQIGQPGTRDLWFPEPVVR